MNKTDLYQFNQWDATDRILREDFNQDNRQAEQALSALSGAISAETAAREQAVAAAKSEAAAAVAAEASARTTAVNNAVNQLNSAKAEASALNSLTAVVNALPFVKLKSIVTSAAAQQVDVNVSDIRLSDYTYWLIIPQLNSGTSTFHLRVNGLSASGAYYNANSAANSLGTYSGTGLGGAVYWRLMAVTDKGSRIVSMTDAVANNGTRTNSSGYVAEAQANAGTLTSLNFTVNGSGSIAAGGRITIYGVKL